MDTCPSLKKIATYFTIVIARLRSSRGNLRSTKKIASLSLAMTIILLIVSFSTSQVFAATGILKQINFQGKVVNANGTNVANGNYDFVFSIYTVATGGTAVWTETRTGVNQVTVTDGIFRVSLGSITALPGSIDFNTDNIYLGINFNNDGEMTPRVQFTAVPQAFNALKVAGLTVTDTTGTFTLAAAKTLTVNNTLTFSGTDATTITFQGTDTYVGRATTDTLTNKTIGTTGLTFSGATTDITTATGEDLTLVANGVGVLKLGDFTTANGVLYVSATDGTVSETAASTGAQCLQTTGAGLAPVWGACASGGGITTVRESDLTPSVGSLTTLEFGPATTSSDEFVVTDQTGGVARVILGTKVVKTDATQTLTNKTTGAITFGTASSDALTFTGSVNSDINFLDANPGTAYTIAGSDSTTAAAAGGNLTLRAGAGLTTGAGGNLVLSAGTSPSGTAGFLALQTAGTERLRLQADGTFLFEKGVQDVVLSITAPATATRTYTIPDFGADDSLVGLAANQALTNKTYNGLTITANGTNTLNIGAGLTLGVSTANKTLTGAGTTLTFAGDFTTSGANALTLTTTGPTNVTLPTSGTLVNSAVTTLSSLTTVGSLVSGTVIGTQTFTTNNIADSGGLTITSGGAGNLTINSASSDITIAAGDSITFAAGTGSGNVTINAGATGTTANLLVKLDTSGTVITTDTSTLNNAVGVALDTKTSGQAVRVAIHGVVTAVADNAVTAGDYIGLGTTTAGRAKSLGTTYPSTAGVQVIGRATSSQATPGSTFTMILEGLDNNVSAGAACSTCVQFATGTPDNTTTSNNLIHLQKSGVNRFVVANTGGLTINGTDSSVVRSTTAEFATGTVGSNLTNANDQIELSDGTIPNAGAGTITTAGQPTTSAAVAAGAITMTRADGKYFVLLGGTATSVYDSVAGTFAAGTALGTATGVGVQAIPRPDGRYLVIHGAAGATRTIVDPIQVVANTAEAGANFCASAGAGSQAFRRANGRYLVVCGNGLATTAIYNPTANSWAAGPSFTVGTQSTGGLALPRPDGRILIVNGGATATTQLYNPTGAAGDIGSFAAGPVLGTGCEINGAGSVALKRPDGKYVVLSKASASTIYDPVANTFTCRTTNGPATALGAGAHAIPLQNGKFLVISGGASTASSIYDPTADTFTTHGTALSTVGAGAHSIMRHDGTWQILVGNSTTTTNNYDTGLPMTGTTTKYTSDDISTTSLNPTSTLKWTAQYESAYSGRTAATNTGFSTIQFFVRTAVNSGGCTTPLNSATDREILQSSDLIRPGSTDNCIRVTAQFNRPVPKRIFDDRGTWTGDGSTILRLDYATPTLFDLQVDNSTVLHRNSFEFNEPNAGQAAPQTETSGPVMTRVEGTTDRLYLPWGRVAEPTLVGTTGFYQGLISGAHPNLPQTTTDGTTVIARDDKQFLVMSAGAANAALYDPATQTFTAQSGAGNIPTAAIGAGAFAVKLPSGKFLLVVGGASTTTNIYDPNAASGSRFVAGPTLSAAAGQGAMAIPNTDGTFTIVHGGAATTSSIYDPVRDTTGTLKAGPVSPVALNCGAWTIPRPKFNEYLVFFGVAEATAGILTTSTYDAKLKIFSPTANSPALPLAAGCGSFAFQRQDGLWVYMAGGGGTAGAGQTAGALYNPDSNVITALGLTFTAHQKGAHVIPRADGTFLMIAGGALTTTNIYVPWGGAFLAAGGPAGAVSTAGPATATAVGDGALSFQRPDGKWVLIVGGATAAATTNLIDAGWYPDGQYLSEQTQVPALAANSTLEWKQTPDNFVRMEIRAAASQAALATTGYTTVGRPGQSFFNAGSETWVQVEVNMRRDFPTFSGNLNGVYLSNGGMAYAFRNISVPTVFEYKINNGMDLLSLQDNGLNILRVTSNGGIYSSATGGFFAGGADLAENYTSTDTLEKGEVVIAAGPHDVKRSTGQYQKDVLGVVSTQPGFVAGAQTEGSFPIALVGRVPVKVSTENGPIRAGDFLTSASIPGYAMKATKAGRVLGKALEDLQDTKMCPAFGMGNLPSTKCGEIMMFVNLTDYMGAPVEVVMAESQLSGLSSQLSDSGQSVLGLSVTDQQTTDNNLTKQDQILAFLKELKDEQASQSASVVSEIFTNRLSAVNEVISPLIVTDELLAKKVKADSIEGLEILTNKISSLNEQVAGIATSSAGVSTSEESKATSEVIAQAGSSEVLFETVLGKLNANGGLVVGGPATFQGETLFEKLVTFVSHVVLRGRVTFEEVPTFNKDTAGFAVIKKDVDSVEVAFEKEYATTPIISINMTFDPIKLADGNTEDPKILQKRIIESNYSYFIVNRTTKGFTIVLNKNASEDLTFSWTALSVKDAKRFESKSEPTPSAIPASVSPTPSPSPSNMPTAAPTATSSAQSN